MDLGVDYKAQAKMLYEVLVDIEIDSGKAPESDQIAAYLLGRINRVAASAIAEVDA